MSRERKGARCPESKAVLRLALIVLVLAGLCLAGYWTGYAEEESRFSQRFRGLAALALTAWYGRYILLPRFRWRALWWFLPPGLTIAVLNAWPFQPVSCLIRLAYAILALVAGLSMVESSVAPCRRAAAACLKGIRARQAESRAVRAQAASAAFLTALGVGIALYLLSVDYVFDYFLYSLCGCGLVWLGFLGAPAVLAARMEKELAGELDELAQLEERALAIRDARALEECGSIRRALERSAKLGWVWRDWLYPLGSSAILLLAALLYNF